MEIYEFTCTLSIDETFQQKKSTVPLLRAEQFEYLFYSFKSTEN